MSPGLLVACIVGGALLLVVAILAIVFSAIGKAKARFQQEIGHEGVVLDAGRVGVTTRFRDFRVPGMYIGVGIRAGSSHVVLTQRRLAFGPYRSRTGLGSIDRSSLSRFQVGVDGGRLHLQTNSPPNGSGNVEMHVSVADPERWKKALLDAGATPSHGG